MNPVGLPTGHLHLLEPHRGRLAPAAVLLLFEDAAIIERHDLDELARPPSPSRSSSRAATVLPV